MPLSTVALVLLAACLHAAWNLAIKRAQVDPTALTWASSVVVFTGNAEFKTNLGPNVIKLPDLIPFLSNQRPVIFDERKMTYVVGRIEMKRIHRSVETDEYHINYVRRRIARK